MRPPIRTASFTGILSVFVLVLLPAASAAPPSADAVFDAMKRALEPPKPSVRTMVFSVHSAEFDETTHLTVRQARKRIGDSMRSVTVVMEPQTVKGVAMLVAEQTGKPNAQYVYFPALRRIRRVGPVSAVEPFLNTDFSYADIGLLDIHNRTLNLEGSKQKSGVTIYELDETPAARWDYARIVDLVNAESKLPVERDYYDVGDKLWKKETFPDTPVIAGIPTPVRIRMEDAQSGDWSEIKVTDVLYDAQIPDDLFDPARLREIADRPFWTKSPK